MEKNQTLRNENKRSSSSVNTAPTTKKLRFSYDSNSQGEVMSDVRLYDVPLHITLDYLNDDINPIQHKSNITSYKAYYSQFKLFGRTLQDMMGDEAASAANLILSGDRKDIENALALVKAKPMLLHVETEGRDPLERHVKGTLLQIAAMAGDVNLKTNRENEVDQGVVEMLIAAGNLSKEEVTESLECVTSKEAQLINEQRNQRIFEAIKKFGEAIIKTEVNYNINFKKCDHDSCKKHEIMEDYLWEIRDLIDQLEKDLQPDTKKVITAGYVFDPSILYKAAKWFELNCERFGGWKSEKSDIFWVKCIGKLQCKLSARDLQMILHGKQVGDIKRSVYTHCKGSSYYDADYLGVDIYLGYYGNSQSEYGENKYSGYYDPGSQRSQFYYHLLQTKTEALQSVCNTQTVQTKPKGEFVKHNN